MPIGIKGFQKGHPFYKGAEKGWFLKGIIPINGIETRFKKGHNSYKRGEEYKKNMSDIKKGKPMLSKRGEKSNFWKGGISKLQSILRNCLEYKNWRITVFSRDRFQCIECGVKGCRRNQLNADHIKSFSFILQENKIKTLEQALKCEELWDINNGRTLCIPCHKKTETWGKNLSMAGY